MIQASTIELAIGVAVAPVSTLGPQSRWRAQSLASRSMARLEPALAIPSIEVVTGLFLNRCSSSTSLLGQDADAPFGLFTGWLDCDRHVVDTGFVSLSEDVSSRRWSFVVFAAAVLTAAVVAVAPVVATSTCATSSAGTTRCSSSNVSLLANEGARLLGVLAVPALVALVSLLVPSRRSATLTAVALTTAALVASASVGIYLIPTAVLAWVAVVATRRNGESV
jgi:hypothetical protein